MTQDVSAEVCPLCATQTELISQPLLNDFMQLAHPYEIYRCDYCGFLFRQLLPSYSSDQEIAAICIEKSLSYGEYTAGSDEVNFRMGRRLTALKRMNLNGGCPRVLDVGCGTGSFLRAVRKAGWEGVGTECSRSSALQDSDIQFVDLAENDLVGYSKPCFDFIHCNHVLEHVISPLALIRAAAVYLVPGGYLCLEVPNEVESLASRIKRLLGIRYNGATAYLDHRSFFRRQDMELLCRSCGLEIQSISTPFTGQSLPLYHRIFDCIQSMLGLGAVIEVWAKKGTPVQSEVAS